jgi:hypothetical protein
MISICFLNFSFSLSFIISLSSVLLSICSFLHFCLLLLSICSFLHYFSIPLFFYFCLPWISSSFSSVYSFQSAPCFFHSARFSILFPAPFPFFLLYNILFSLHSVLFIQLFSRFHSFHLLVSDFLFFILLLLISFCFFSLYPDFSFKSWSSVSVRLFLFFYESTRTCQTKCGEGYVLPIKCTWDRKG